MHFKSKRTSLLILGITAVVCSRAMFLFFNDPEGPNLLVVGVAALIVYFLSLPVYLRSSSIGGFRRLSLTIVAQVVIVTIFYFCLN